MFKWFKDLFSTEIQPIKETVPVTLETVEIFDTVWVKDNNKIQQGWIFEKTKKRFLIVAGENEYIFHYSRPLDRTEIEFNNKILYFNKPCS